MKNFNDADKQLILDLVRDAQLLGLTSIEYNGLKLTLRPISQTQNSAPTAYGAKWSTTIVKDTDNG